MVNNDTYVDDMFSGTRSSDKTDEVTDQLQGTMATGGYFFKGISKSGEDPPSNLSADQCSVLVGGLRWFPKGDFTKLKVKDLNFNREVRGKNLKLVLELFQKNLHCVIALVRWQSYLIRLVKWHLLQEV